MRSSERSLKELRARTEQSERSLSAYTTHTHSAKRACKISNPPVSKRAGEQGPQSLLTLINSKTAVAVADRRFNRGDVTLQKPLIVRDRARDSEHQTGGFDAEICSVNSATSSTSTTTTTEKQSLLLNLLPAAAATATTAAVAGDAC